MINAKKYALIDLHLHLDGSMSLECARSLAEKQGIALPDDAELLTRLRVSDDCQDLNEYLERFELPLSLLQTADSISESVERLSNELAAEGLIYAEIRFAPQLHLQKGLTQEEVVIAAIDGLSRGKLSASLILCCMRGASNREQNIETVRLVSKYLGKGVCAVDLAGAEALFPNENFIDVIEYAKSLSLPMTLHAGEALGSESVSSAIELGADRIGHGVRSIENPELLQILSQKKIALELCPTSNMNTRVFETMSEYPIRAFLEAGILITINTDNTSVSATSLANEYQKITDTFSLTESELQTLALNSAYATFLCGVEKEKLVERIKSRF
ncbi:MAG: adenosine deaminase [Ruminococcaceae bacterium]|nr:adenosine deaminase [Oscillospiraceae bacterium]